MQSKLITPFSFLPFYSFTLKNSAAIAANAAKPFVQATFIGGRYMEKSAA